MLFALLATLCWSSTGIFIDALYTNYALTPVEISAWRAIFVAPAVGLWLAWRHPGGLRLSRKEAPFYFWYGLIGIALFNLVWSVSVEINKAAVATTLIFSAPVFVALGARLLWGDRVRLTQAGAIVINLLGCALVAGVYNPAALLNSPLGMLVGLASGMSFAASTLFGKAAARAGKRNSASIIFYTFAFAALCLVLFGLATEGGRLFLLPLDGVGWLLLATLSLGPTLAGYAFFNLSLQYLPAGVVSLLNTLEPPITALIALLLLGRVMNGWQWLGTGLIIGGVLIMQTATFGRSHSATKID